MEQKNGSNPQSKDEDIKKILVEIEDNPSRSKMEKCKFIVELTALFISVFSIILVLRSLDEMKLQRDEMQLQLNEMQIQRNNAYMPDLVFETAVNEFPWEYYPTWSSDRLINYVGNIKSPVELQIPIKNVGVGVAKKVTLTLDDNNFRNWLSELNNLDPKSQFELIQNDDILILSNGEVGVQFPKNHKEENTFLLPNGAGTYVFKIPKYYISLLNEICAILAAKPITSSSSEKTFSFPLYTATYPPFFESWSVPSTSAYGVGVKPYAIPDLEVLVSFEDVQGVKYNKTILLQVDIFLDGHISDSGGVAYSIFSMR